MGGGRTHSCSILEAFDHVEALTGKPMRHEYVDQPREGDHQCYISDVSRFRAHYSQWEMTKSLENIFREIVNAWTVRLRL